ncbi:MAG: GyrI-like domain-containing protein [Bacteroidota bacterium]
MEKIDFKKELKHLYKPSAKKVEWVEVPPMNYLMVDGLGAPGSQSYQEALESLFPMAYGLKFSIKKELEIDYTVMPLEGLWWAEDYHAFTMDGRRDEWKWTMMIMQPEWITAERVEAMREDVRKKKNPAALHLLRFESYAEGKAAQTMHIGPFSEEGPTIERVHETIENDGFSLSGKHHEIYLSDIRRADPAKWKTVLRQPATKGKS